MPVIPENVYRQVEKRLRGRQAAVAKAEQALYRAQQRAYAVSAPAPDKVGGGRGSAPGSRVEKAALSVLKAEEKLDTVRKWEDVLRLLDRVFHRETPEGKAVELVYNRGYDKKSAARILQCSRETLAKRLDTYVCHAALIAAGEGLISVKEGTE